MHVGQYRKIAAFHLFEKQDWSPFRFLFKLYGNGGDFERRIDFPRNHEKIFRTLILDGIQKGSQILRHNSYDLSVTSRQTQTRKVRQSSLRIHSGHALAVPIIQIGIIERMRSFRRDLGDGINQLQSKFLSRQQRSGLIDYFRRGSDGGQHDADVAACAADVDSECCRDPEDRKIKGAAAAELQVNISAPQILSRDDQSFQDFVCSLAAILDAVIAIKIGELNPPLAL